MLSGTVVSSLCEAAHSEHPPAHCKSVFSLISMDTRQKKKKNQRGEGSPDHMYIYESILDTLNGLPWWRRE